MVPQLWTDTVESHRIAVRDAILDAAGRLVAEHGLAGVNMSSIAEHAGIGRATLYKYFPDVAAVLGGWHERLLADHVGELSALRTGRDDPRSNLVSVLRRYAELTHRRDDSELAALLHRGPHVIQAQAHLRALISELIAQAAVAGEVRRDVAADELAAFCLHALTAAGALSSKAAIERLVDVTLDGLRPSHEG